MANENVIKIILTQDDYYEAYAPFSKDEQEVEDRIKRAMLKKEGWTDEQIDSVIDQLEIDYVAGVDGQFDDGPYTPIRLVRNFQVDIPVPPPIPTPIPQEPEKGEEDKEPEQIMIKQFYGDRAAERDRKKRFERFKSNIVKKPVKVYDLDGKESTIEVYTVGDYPQKKEDTTKLMLEGYATRLERLSRAHQKDFSPYERQLQTMISAAISEITQKYQDMHEANPEEAEKLKKDAIEEFGKMNSPEFRKKAIQALIDQDTEFIETNNYGYNSHQNTQENLRTLGKFGEKSVKAPVSVEQSKLQRFGLNTMNALIALRNHTVAPVNKAIGTFVAAPIHRTILGVKKVKTKDPINVDGYLIPTMEDMIATSQEYSSGMFKNKPMHRYEARKNYFIEQLSMREQTRGNGEDDGKKTKRTTLGKLIKFAIVPRIQAAFRVREGNAAVLSAGLSDLEKASIERDTRISMKKHRLISTYRRIDAHVEEITKLNDLLKVIDEPDKIEEIKRLIEIREKQKLILEGRAYETAKNEVDSVQPDAVSMSTHDKANKATITTTIKGLKMAARVAVGTLIGKNLYREVAQQSKKPDTVTKTPDKVITTPDKVVTKPETIKTVSETIFVPETRKVTGLTSKEVEGLTFRDIYNELQDTTIFRHTVEGGKTAQGVPADFFRGLRFSYNGKMYSGLDGIGYGKNGIQGLASVVVDEIDGDKVSVVSVMHEIIKKQTGEDIPTERIAEMLGNEINGICLNSSWTNKGINGGWSIDATDVIKSMIQSHTREEVVNVKKVIEKTITIPGKTKIIPGETIVIPGTTEIIPGKVITEYVDKLNPVVVAALGGLSALTAGDINDALRWTRSQESIRKRSRKNLKEMENENAEISKKNGKEYRKKKVETPDKKRNIKAFQRNNKSKKRFWGYRSKRMESQTKFRGFSGSKRKDMQSGYDENALRTYRPDTAALDALGTNDEGR